MDHSFFIHSSVDGHLGCFHVLAIVNSAAVNFGVHVSLLVLVSSEYMPRSGTAGSYGGFISVFLRDRHTIFYNGCINLHSHQQCKSGHSLFCISSPAFIVCRLFDDGHSDPCEVIPHYSFDLRFSNWWCWAFFHVPFGLYALFGRRSFQIFYFLIGLFICFDIELPDFFVNFGD